MAEYRIIAIHKPTGNQHEMGIEPTVDEAIYTLGNYVEFDETDVYDEWAFQVVDNNNHIVAYGKTLKEVKMV